MKKRVLSMLMALALCLTLLPAPAWAEGETETTAKETVRYMYYTYNGSQSSDYEASCAMLSSAAGDVVLTEQWYAVKGDVTINGTVTVTDTHQVNLILCDGATLTITGGLMLWSGASAPQLTVYGQTGETGKMLVTNSKGGYALYTDDNATAYIRLRSGTLTATGQTAAFQNVACWNTKDDYTPNDPMYCDGDPAAVTSVTVAPCDCLEDYKNFEYKQRTGYDMHRATCKRCGFILNWDGTENTGYQDCDFYNCVSDGAAGHHWQCVDCGNKRATEEHDFQNGYCTACRDKDPDYVFSTVAQIGDKEYTSLQEALDAAGQNDTVVLAGNVTSGALPAIVRNQVTLNLNGYTVDELMVGQKMDLVAGKPLDESIAGDLTVVGGGKTVYGKIDNLDFVFGTLDIQDGVIGTNPDLTAGEDGMLSCEENSGEVTISGGIVYGMEVNEGASVTVSGGDGHKGRWTNNGGTLTITGGSFDSVTFSKNTGTIAISGGTFGTITNINGSSSSPLMPLLADNYAFYQGDNAQNSTEKTLTNVTVRPHTHSFENGKCDCGVAAIVVDNNNSCYNTLQAALGAAADNASITSVTLGQDLTEDVTFNGSAAGSLTLNMNGHKLEAEAGVPLTVTGGTLRIEGTGEINQNTASNATAFPAISLTGGKLVITGDLAAQGGYDSSSGRKPAIRAEEGELDLQGNVSLNGGLTITGTAKLTNPLTQGTFYVDASETGNAIAITDSEVPGGKVYKKALELLAKDYAFYRANGSLADAGGAKLKTGTYTIKSHTCSYTHDETNGIAYCNCGRSHAHRDLSDEKSVLVNGVCPICGYHCPHKNIGDDGVCKDCNAKMVAKVTVGETTTYTADLADALNKAANGTTITLLADTEISAYVNIYAETATGADQMVVTLDLAGHTVTSNCKPIVIGADRNITASYYGTLKIVGTGNITLEYAILNAREKGVLDLTDWTGGSISSVTVTRNGNTNEEGKLIVGKDAGHIGSLAFYNWTSAEITNTKLYGGSYGEITTSGSYTVSLAGLLPNGCAFKNADGSFANATASKLYNVTVSACDHGGKNGFDKNATACPYCNAPAVAETALNNGEGNRLQRRFADLQTALDADRDGGAELTLLTDVTGDYTIDGTKNTKLDLNGHSIKGTVTVKAAVGSNTTTLSNTKNTTTARIDKVVAHSEAELARPDKPAVIGTLTLAEGATWKTILSGKTLGYKVLNAGGTHKWYARDDVNGSQLNNVIINILPITFEKLNLTVDGKDLTGNQLKVERGTTVQLCASCNKDAEVTFSIKQDGATTPITLSGNDVKYTTVGTSTTLVYVAEYIFNDVGSYTISFTATKDGYSVTSTQKKLTVTKPNLSNAKITFPDGNEAAFNYWTATGVPMFIVMYNGKELEKDKDFTITGGSSTYDVGPCTLTIKATENGAYTGSKSAEWTVRPLKAAVSVGDIIKTYDGTTNLPANAKITFKSADSYYTGVTLSLAKGTDYEVLNAHYDSADASQEEKTISFTIRLKNKGYVFEDGTTQKDFTLNGADFDDKTFQINKATVPMNNPTGTLNIINGTCQTYTYDFNNILPGLSEGKYGTISYGQADISLVSQSEYNYGASTAVSDRGVLTLAQFSAEDGKMTGRIGTVKVTVTTTNYENFQLKLVLNAVDQIKPEPDGTITASEITYGDALSKSTISGKMKDPDTGKSVNGTFAWTDGTINPNAGDYEADWTFTPAAGYEKYATATGTVTIKVNKATPTFTAPTAQENLTYTGQEQALITAGSVTSGGTMQYSLTENGTYSQDIPTGTNAGAYTVWYRVIGDANHNDTTPASVPVRIGQKPLTITGVTAVSKPYDGMTDAGITSVTFDGVNLNRGTDYTVTASFDDASAGNGKNVTATVTLMGQTAKNYFLEQSSFHTTGNITKAAAPDFTKATALVIVNGHEKTYTVTLPALPKLETPKEYGALTYEIGEIKLNGGYYTSGAKVENGELTLPIQKNDVETTGSVGTVSVVIKSANYEDITLTVNVNATNKLVPTVTAPTANALTYNGAEQALVTAGKTTGGTMLYRLGDSKWSEQIPTAKNAGEYTVWYKVQGDAEYADVAEQSLTVTVAKKAVTVTALDKSAYTGSTAPDLSSPETDKDYKVEGLVGADTLSGTVTLTYEQTPDMSKTGKTTINITGTLSNDNYEITYVPGTLTVSDRPSSGGVGSSSGGSSSGGGTVKTETTKNNDGSVTKTETKKDGTKVETTTGKDGSVSQTTTNPNGSSVTETKAADGSTGTVKTDKHGQTTAETTLSNKAIENAKKNGEAVKAPVEVEASRDSSTAPTVKVELPKNSGDTKVEIPVSNVKPGTVAVLVHPDGTEEIVKNSLPTEDGIQLTVNGGATVKIVDNSKDFIDTRNHWAKDAIDFVSARGLLNGTSANTFSPNAPTTRAQLWTVLARQADADLTGGANWYEKAQAWAKEKGISDGANPNGTINRAQMVTMLWRAMGQPATASGASFADVPADSYYAQAVAWAIENGITAGVGGGRFDPNSTCTRAQIATFLYRLYLGR